MFSTLKRAIRKLLSKLFKMRDLHLYINGQEVDLGDESLVLYNWSETELSNPSNTQNSFSKVITLKGTKKNNRVFSHLWNIERVQTYDGELNASRRIPFRITYDGDNVFEEGYCKLQNIKRVNGVYQYEISLFGMIGNFLNNLATNYTDGSVKTLADLKYYFNGDGDRFEYDLDFNINADTVKEAWENIAGYQTKWEVLNFANCYNGVPTTLDANKVLIDGASAYSPLITTSVTEDNVTYTPANDRVIVQTQNKMTKDEVKDFRSYLMTPVISAKSIIKAISDKENNSGEYDNGYDVELDQEFFNDFNPYYEKAWMTLPQITSIKRSNTSNDTSETTIYNISLLKKETIGNNVRYIFNIQLPNVLQEWADFDITMKFGTYFQGGLYEGVNLYLRDYFSGLTANINAYGVQAYAITDEADSNYENIIAGGNLLWINSDGFAYYDPSWGLPEQKFTYEKAVKMGYSPKYTPSKVDNISTAKWNKIYGSTYHMLNYTVGESFVQEFNFKLTAPSGTRNIRVCFDMLASNLYNNLPGDYVFYDTFSGRFNPVQLPNIQYRSAVTKYKTQSGFYSNRLITKQNLLTTNYSVKDWLLSYCKMFGLYIWYDLATNKIHIDTRKTFYQRDNITNIGNRIDLTKDYSIKPVLAETKFYNMTQQQADTDLANDYKTEYGKVYGMKTIDTGVDLDTSQKELMDLKLKSTIMGNVKSVYNYKPTTMAIISGSSTYNVSGVTPYLCDGVSYVLYNGGDISGSTKDMTIDSYVIQDLFSGLELVSGSPLSDIIDKPLFKNEDKGTESSSVLLFLTDYNFDMQHNGYYLSDDIPAMAELNEKPTWILTNNFNNKGYVKKFEYMPEFSRYWTFGGRYICYSLDFGSPRKLYIDNTINTEESTLYDRYYGTYYGDLFDVNTKVLNCYYRPTNIMSINDLRRFYWFDNAVWRLNKVTDYNPEKPDFVKVEFVKVQDLENITCGEATILPRITLILNSTTVPAIGGTITGVVKTYDYGPWNIEGDDGLYVYPNGYSTNSEITIDVPPNVWQEEMSYFLGVSAGDVSTGDTIKQEAGGGEYAVVSFTMTNQTSETIRLGAMLYYEDGIAYRTLAPGASITYDVPIPANGTFWNYDIVLSDVFGNAGGYIYTFTKGATTIQGDSMEEFNEEAKNIGAQTIQGGTITVTE